MSRNSENTEIDEEKMSVTKYISLNEFDEKIIMLLKVTCKDLIMTKHDWDIKLENLLSRKTR